MGNSIRKLETERGTPVRYQSITDADDIDVEKLVDKLQSSSLLNDKSETNTVNKHRHHRYYDSLDAESSEDSSSSELQSINSNEDSLNEDCLLEIFSYLSLDDMMQVKAVCKKWYQVSQQWFQQIQTLECEINKIMNGIHENRVIIYKNYYESVIYEKTRISCFNDVIPILNSYGHYIKYYKATITIDNDSDVELAKFIFQWIPKLCKNISHVEINGKSYYDIPWNFRIMATNWKKLENISIRYLPKSVPDNFPELLRNNKQLKNLKLTFDYYNLGDIDDKFCSDLPTTIKEIIIEGLLISERKKLCHFLSASKNFTSLQSLELSSFFHLSDGMIAAIADIKSLNHLYLHRIGRYESQWTFNPIANMKGLKSLYLICYRDLNEDSFINIVESCIQLEHLDIRRGIELTDKGMTAIAKLERLKYLGIHVKDVTLGSIISSCGGLEVLRCYKWEINNNDAVKLLEKSTNLRFVDFICCSNLTNDILQAANEIANDRKNNILYIRRRECLSYNEDIDTPYFKYFSRQGDIPLDIFPGDIRCYLRRINADFSEVCSG